MTVVVDFVTEIVEKKVELEFQFAILKNYSMPKNEFSEKWSSINN